MVSLIRIRLWLMKIPSGLKLKLIAAEAAWASATNGTRKNPNADFQQQFIGDALLTPGWIAACHLGNKPPQLGGNVRSSSRPRLVGPAHRSRVASGLPMARAGP